MGFLRRLFATKKSTATSSSAPAKRRWSFVREKVRNSTAFNDSKLNASTSQLDTYDADGIDANKRAIAVAAATAAVAEAALAAAHAAAEVVRLTSGKGAEISASTAPHLRISSHFSAIKIQSAFRGYLARRALKALKALVKLQALVRGHIVRKQTADMLRRIQTLVRVQSRVSASRTLMSDSSRSCTMSSLSSHPFPESPYKMGHQYRTYSNKYDGPSILKRCGSNSNFRDAVNLEKERLGTNWLDHWMEESLWSNCNDTSKRYGHSDDEKSDKILEVDTWKPHLDPQRGTPTFQTPRRVRTFEYNNQSFMTLVSPSQRSTKAPYPNTNQPSLDVLSTSSLKLSSRKESGMRTTGNSPHAFSASSRPGSARRGSFTPSRNEHSMCYFNGYSGYPNYMANTESSQAKVRSQSVPRQRLELEKYCTSRSVQGSWDARAHSSKGFIQDADHSSSNSLNKLGIARLR